METGTEHGASHPRGVEAGSTDPTDQIKAKASELTHTARHRAMSTLEEQKTHVCELLDRVADDIQDDRIGRHAAGYARRGSEYLRHRSADEIFESLRTEVRSRPGLLLSACFIAGLAIARVMRSAGDEGGRAHGTWRDDDETWRRGPEWQGQPTWRGEEP